MKLLECENLTLAYDSTVVENLSFSVNEGDYLCILGTNGSGKSTLIKALLGLKKVNGGRIKTYGCLHRGEIGYISQKTADIKNFPASCEEVVLSGCLSKKRIFYFYTKKDKDEAKKWMTFLSVYDLKDRCICDLSGGQKQRIMLARALCAAKRLIILDEPTSGLDAQSTKDMYSAIKMLNKSHNITVIMVTHDKTAIKDANTILELDFDKNFFGNIEEYRKEKLSSEGDCDD